MQGDNLVAAVKRRLDQAAEQAGVRQYASGGIPHHTAAASPGGTPCDTRRVTFVPMVVDPTPQANAFGPSIPPTVLQFSEGYPRQNSKQQATKTGRKTR